MKTCQQSQGLTLIEVLIALVIVAIAMTAIIKSSAQNIKHTSYLQDKTIAMWVGQNALSEARLGLLRFSGSEKQKNVITLLGREWYVEAAMSPTPNKRIKKIEVNVFDHENNTEDASPLITLESYKYDATVT